MLAKKGAKKGVKKTKKRGGVKCTPADSAFSKCVRMRANWTCEKCGVNLEHDKGQLDCSHFISRKYLSVRYHPQNALAHCKSCHRELGGGQWGGGNVAEFANHYDFIFGAEKREEVRLLSKQLFHDHAKHIKDIAKHYRNEFKRMEELRSNGNMEYLEFDMYDI